jgi:LTXXQ motif family protein
MAKMRLWAMAPGLVGVLILAFAGIGQGQLGIGGPGEGVKLALLRLPAVQKELDLTPKQKQEIARIGEDTKAAKKQIDSASKGQEKTKGEAIPKGMPDPARDARDAELAGLEQRAEGSLKKILDTKQRTRLSEISLQVEGPRAFLKPELIQLLDLNDDQVEQIQGILGVVRDQQEQVKAIQKRSAELGNLALEKVSKEQQKSQFRAIALKVDKKGMAEIGKILSKKQRDRYNRLLGEPFNLAGATDEKGRKLFDESADLASVLLKMPPVREELKLTDEQSAALDRDEPAARVLKPAQRTRLDQVALQAEGPSAFTRPDVIRSLKLNDEQLEKIQDILGGLGDARRQIREAKKQADEARKADGDPAPDPAVEKTRKEQEKGQMQAAADKLGKGVMSRIASILTRAQRDAFRKRLGEPFDFAKLQGPGAQAIAKEATPFVKEGTRP